MTEQFSGTVLRMEKTVSPDPSRDRNPDVSHRDAITNWPRKNYACVSIVGVFFTPNKTLIHNSLPGNNRLPLVLASRDTEFSSQTFWRKNVSLNKETAKQP